MKISGECANMDLDIGTLSGTPTIDLSSILFNVDLKRMMGDMYDKYDKFMIIFNNVGGWSNATSYSTATGTIGLTATALWSIGMTGLDWISNSYNGQESTLAFFPNKVVLPVANYANNNFSNYGNGVCFRKPMNPNVVLNITPYLTRSGSSAIAVVASGTVQIDLNYSFTIYGLYDDN